MPFRIALPFLALLLIGCGTDPCQQAGPVVEGRGGPAALSILVSGQAYSPGRTPFDIACVDVLVVRVEDYADTLAVGRGRVQNGHVRITNLPTGRADLIVGGTQFFPVKQTGVPLRNGHRRHDHRLLLYRWTGNVHTLNRIEVGFRPGSTFEDIQPVYRVYDDVEAVQAGPSSLLRFTSETTMEAEVNLLRLSRQLLGSPHVLSARPLVDFNLMYPTDVTK